MNDLYFMDYDTYHQIIGGSFLDYVLWMQSIRPDLLEDFSKSSLNNALEEVEKSVLDQEDTFHFIILFLLEFLGRNPEVILNPLDDQEMPMEERIKEYLRLYQQSGMSHEDTIHMVKRYLKDLRR